MSNSEGEGEMVGIEVDGGESDSAVNNNGDCMNSNGNHHLGDTSRFKGNLQNTSGRVRRDAAASAMQGWHAQQLCGLGEVGKPIIKNKSISSAQKGEKHLKNNGVKQKRPNTLELVENDTHVETDKQLITTVVDVGPPADWVKINVQESAPKTTKLVVSIVNTHQQDCQVSSISRQHPPTLPINSSMAEDGAYSQALDAESQYLMDIRLQSKQHHHEEEEDDDSGMEWDKYKENVRPLKRGRDVTLLNHSLKSHSNSSLQHSLNLTRRNIIGAIDDYEGDDPLLPWLRCIKWVQEAYPAGGDSSGLLLIYEQCVRAFWHHPRYKDDLRYLQVWLQYAEHCRDAQVIYTFLDANNIGHSHSLFYISYALHMETKHKIRTADDIFNRGFSINAQPREKLEAAYRKFLARSLRRPKAITDEDSTENGQLGRSFGTLLSRGDSRRNQPESDAAKKSTKGNEGQRVPLSVYKDTNRENVYSYQLGSSQPWDTLPTQKDRNKENNAIPAKWTSYKIPQRPGSRFGGATQGIQVFVDEECSESNQTHREAGNASNLQLKERDEQSLKRESELLKENPLRNFPTSSYPR